MRRNDTLRDTGYCVILTCFSIEVESKYLLSRLVFRLSFSDHLTFSSPFSFHFHLPNAACNLIIFVTIVFNPALGYLRNAIKIYLLVCLSLSVAPLCPSLSFSLSLSLLLVGSCNEPFTAIEVFRIFEFDIASSRFAT